MWGCIGLKDSGCRGVWGLWIRRVDVYKVWGLGCRCVSGLRYRIQGLGSRVLDFYGKSERVYSV